MITWITGESGSGKTTLAKKLIGKNTILLDGDSIRPAICEDLEYGDIDRRKNNLRVARLANLLNNQGFDVVVATICSGNPIKQEVYWICKCKFVHMEGKFNALAED